MTTADRPLANRHGGSSIDDVVCSLAETTRLQRYIAIGLASGAGFGHVACEHGVGVDPEMALEALGAANKTRVSLFRLTSNEFFHIARPRRLLGGPADLVLLRGTHRFEHLLRDFLNAEAVCAGASIIAFDNALPLTAAMADRDPAKAVAEAAGTPFASWWTGDVWKLIPILRRYRPDLTLTLADAQPAGLVLVSGLDPSSRVLSRHYDAIVQAFMTLPNASEEIASLHADGGIVTTDEALARLSRRRFVETPPPLSSRLHARVSSALGRWRQR